MKAVVVTDKKPTDCNDCLFCTEILVSDKDGRDNYMNIVSGCHLTNKEIGCNCPLLDDEDYINSLNEDKQFTLFVEDIEV